MNSCQRKWIIYNWFGIGCGRHLLTYIVLSSCYEWLNWGRVTHIWVSKLTIIGSDNGLSPGRRQAIIWINDGILLIWPLGTNFRFISKFEHFHSRKCVWMCRLRNGVHLVSASICSYFLQVPHHMPVCQHNNIHLCKVNVSNVVFRRVRS